MRHQVTTLVIALALLGATVSPAQNTTPQPPADQLQRAATAFAAGNWAEASVAYETLAKAYPAHALSRFRYGVTLLELGRLPEAEANLREGQQLGMPIGAVEYRLGQLYAETKRPDSAIAALRRAASNQFFTTPGGLTSDRHLASLATHPAWQQVLDAFDAIARPCMHDQRARQFDFWVGDWDVRGVGVAPVGPAARNTVTLNYNGCVVIEHWKAPGGSEGESYNLFDRSYGEWRQTWVDNIGGQHDYRGGLVGKDMVYLGTTPAAGGALGRVMTRLTFFNISPDSVRQFSETSPDSGRTWQTAYNLMYVRRKP